MRATDWNQERVDALLARLSELQVEGPGRGGPHAGILHNDLTRELLSFGKGIVPSLVERLPESGFDEAVYIVFLLRELGATEARPAVRKLQSEVAQRSAGRDLTLRMQIDYFLRDT